MAESSPDETHPAAAVGDRLVSGARIDDYVIDELIDSGAMGQVYRATHAVVGKKVALKVLGPSHGPKDVERLIQEARLINEIGHPNIVDVMSFGRLEDGRGFLVMELLEGETLARRLERGPIELAESVRLLVPVVDALRAARATGVVHRDVKPGNIFLVRGNDGENRVKLLDFGIAKAVTEEGEGLTTDGMILGTPAYFSPEQASGRPLSSASDVYSLGVVWFHMLSGQLPFTGDSSVEIAFSHIKEEPPELRDSNESVPPHTAALVRRMLAKQPDARPTLDDLRDLLSPEQVPLETTVDPARRALPLGLGLTMAAAVLTMLAFVLLSNGDTDSAGGEPGIEASGDSVRPASTAADPEDAAGDEGRPSAGEAGEGAGEAGEGAGEAGVGAEEGDVVERGAATTDAPTPRASSGSRDRSRTAGTRPARSEGSAKRAGRAGGAGPERRGRTGRKQGGASGTADQPAEGKAEQPAKELPRPTRPKAPVSDDAPVDPLGDLR